jgi:hypothetical protein
LGCVLSSSSTIEASASASVCFPELETWSSGKVVVVCSVLTLAASEESSNGCLCSLLTDSDCDASGDGGRPASGCHESTLWKESSDSAEDTSPGSSASGLKAGARDSGLGAEDSDLGTEVSGLATGGSGSAAGESELDTNDSELGSEGAGLGVIAARLV